MSIHAQEATYFLHTVERGQTLYSLSQMYKISQESIIKLNPGSDKGIQTGTSLKIPQESGSYFYHTIQPKETLYSVSRQYQMKGEDIIAVNPGLSIETFSIGKIIRIPTNKVTTPIEGTNEAYNMSITNALLNADNQVNNINSLRVALLLPFGLKEGTTPKNAATNRMVEYYEGILLALEDIKKSGISVDLQVYDTGSEVNLLNGILQKTALQNVHLIIGGLSDKQIKLIASFASDKKIPYIIPFTSKSDEPLNNHYVYQINTPQSYLYSKASAAFCNQYKRSNIIFYIPKDDGNKTDFVETLQKDLKAKYMSYKVIGTSNDLLAEIQGVVSENANNVFIPADDRRETLLKLMTPLKGLLDAQPQLSVSMFGYPAWQTYATDYTDDFFRLDASFFSVFYANPTSPKVKSFNNLYQRWYSRELINIFPKYGMLGYDTGLYFIQSLQKYGTLFEINPNRLNYKGVQMDFYFEQVNNWGGFINTNIYWVEFNPNFTITSKSVN
ncbi:peptidase M23 [Bacteroidia bacterium]|nr:peptidase M23 [Bacteroidia bacterium]